VSVTKQPATFQREEKKEEDDPFKMELDVTFLVLSLSLEDNNNKK
jgi:hypothetical protein